MVGEQVRKYLDERGIKYSAVADAVGMKRPAMYQSLNGNRSFLVDEYYEVCKFLDVPFDSFIVNDMDKEPR